MENKLSMTELLSLNKMAMIILSDELFDREIVENVITEITLENNLPAIYI